MTEFLYAIPAVCRLNMLNHWRYTIAMVQCSNDTPPGSHKTNPLKSHARSHTHAALHVTVGPAIENCRNNLSPYCIARVQSSVRSPQCSSVDK